MYEYAVTAASSPSAHKRRIGKYVLPLLASMSQVVGCNVPTPDSLTDDHAPAAACKSLSITVVNAAKEIIRVSSDIDPKSAQVRYTYNAGDESEQITAPNGSVDETIQLKEASVNLITATPNVYAPGSLIGVESDCESALVFSGTDPQTDPKIQELAP